MEVQKQLHVLLNFLLLASSIKKKPNPSKVLQNSNRQGQTPWPQRWFCRIFILSSIGSEFHLLTVLMIARNIWFSPLEDIPLGSGDLECFLPLIAMMKHSMRMQLSVHETFVNLAVFISRHGQLQVEEQNLILYVPLFTGAAIQGVVTLISSLLHTNLCLFDRWKEGSLGLESY